MLHPLVLPDWIAVLTLAGVRDDLEIQDLDPVDPSVQALVQLAEPELVS